MRRLNDFLSSEYELLGEIDSGLIVYSRGERMDFADVWPGKRTDIASLERNAAAFRRQERRRFFTGLKRLLIKTAKLVFTLPKRLVFGLRSANSGRNNFTTILAGSYNAALYRDQIPEKDYRDD